MICPKCQLETLVDNRGRCQICRANELKAEIADLPALDNHGAVLDPQAATEQRFTEMDTPDEFSGLIIQKKLDFAARATIDKCSDLARLKACTDAIKTHFSNSFAGWLAKGIPLSTDDPLLLNVVVETQLGYKITEAYKSFDFKGLLLPLSQTEKLNSVLFELPLLFQQVESALRKKRRVVCHLKWWGTAKQMRHEEFLRELMQNATRGATQH